MRETSLREDASHHTEYTAEIIGSLKFSPTLSGDILSILTRGTVGHSNKTIYHKAELIGPRSVILSY